MHDSNENDALSGRSSWYALATPDATAPGEAFDYVKATKNKAGTDTLDVDAVDCFLEQEGDWI